MEGLKPFKYGVIYADPAWAYDMRSDKGYEKSPEAHYPTMSEEEITALPVADYAAGDCLLWMWSTWPHLDQALRIMKAWGFTYKTGGAWLKRTVTDKSAFGTGYIFRSSTEPFLIGTIGAPECRVKNQRNEIITLTDEELFWNFPDGVLSARREHSRKPPEAREILERMFPRYFKAELFATEPWGGNDIWAPKAHVMREGE